MTQQTNQREVKYRGLTYEGVWVYGVPTFLIQEDCDENIIDGIRVSWEENVDIKPETLSEFTGRQDKNGREIYESDRNQDGGVVIWSKDDASFCWEYKDIEVQPMGEEDEWCEITGSIYDDN